MSTVTHVTAQMNGLHLEEQASLPLVATLVPSLKTQSAVHFAYKTMLLSIESLEKMNLSDFDPLVSDCACQIRALYVALFARKFCTSLALQQEVSSLKTRLTSGLERMQQDLEALAEAHHLKVSEEIATLALCFLLTKTKKIAGDTLSGVKETTVYEQANMAICPLDAEPEQGDRKAKKSKKKQEPNRAKQVVDAAKVALSKTSCAFMRKCSESLELDMLAKLMLEKSCVILKREEIACFATMQIVFKMALQKGIPLLVKVRKATSAVESLTDRYDTHIFLRPLKKTGFVAFRPRDEDMNVPLIVIEAQRSGEGIQDESAEEYQARLGCENMLEITELNAAAHKQYSDARAQIPLIEEIASKMPMAAELLLLPLQALANKAHAMGSSYKSQRLLAITHIFCDTLQNQKGQVSHEG